MSNSQPPSIAALRQFVAIQEAGGIASAARKLRLSQPALSRNIKRLEEIVGAPLLDRHTRGADLTLAGKSLLKHVTRALLEIEHGFESARKSAGVARKELRIGAGALFSYAVIPSVLLTFEEEFPDYKISIDTVPYEGIVDALTNRDIDICVHGIPTGRHESLTTRSVIRGKRSILCANTHPLAQLDRAVTAEDIAAFAFVVFPRVGNQMQDIDQVFHDNLLNPPRVSFETDRLAGALSILAQGRHVMYGSALLASPKVNAELVTLQTAFDLGDYEIGFTYRSDFEMDSGANRFMKVSRKALKEAIEPI